MHNLKDIRNNIKFFKKKISERHSNIDFDELIELDIENRELIKNKEKLEYEKKLISKKKDPKQFNVSKEISNKISKIEIEQKNLEKKIWPILHTIPNIALDDVPVGKDDTFNKEIKKSGTIPDFKFRVKSHDEIGINLELMDFDIATKTSGSRFVYLKGKLAELERALSNFMLDIHTREFGYQEISPPLIANENTMFGTGQLPKFENDQFEIKLENDQKNI